MKPHYYLMKEKKILRLEEEHNFSALPAHVRAQAFTTDIESLDQAQANWRVVIFRDEIMEFEEYLEWLASTQHLAEEAVAETAN